MAQKIIICEGAVGKDLLEQPALASCIADGMEVRAVSGYSTQDNRHMVVVLLSEVANDSSDETGGDDTPSDNETQEGNETQGGGE